MRARVAEIMRRVADRLRRDKDWPPYFVRVSTRFSEAVRIVYAVKNEGPPWTSDLVSRVCDAVLEEQGVDISIYAADTPDRFDGAHALSVMASSISTDDFGLSAREALRRKLDDASVKAREGIVRKNDKKQELKDDFARKVVTFVLPRSVFGDASLQRTPYNNMNFAPADEFHHDARPRRVEEFARMFLDAVRRGDVVCTFVRQQEYRTQASVVLSWCVGRFGSLSGGAVPKGWSNGKDLSATEQLARLRAIAGDEGIQARVELNR